MRLLFFFISLCTFVGCRDNQAAAQTGQTVVGQVDRNKKVRLNAQDAADGAGALILRMADVTATPGDKVCLPVEADNFSNLIGFQFTMRFDSAALEFENFREFGLPGYGAGNFGDRFADRGYLSTLWTENNLTGKTIPDASKLFEVCFTNLQPSGKETEVFFQDGPTNFEVITSDMGKRVISYANGTVKSE